jgi:phosphatidate cytidylyltransferase
VSHRFDDEPGRRLPTEGVRILGAEEAEAALHDARYDPREEGGVAAETREVLTFDPDVDTDPDDTLVPLPRRSPDEGPTWSASTSDDSGSDDSGSEDSGSEDLGDEPPLGTTAASPAPGERDSVDADLEAWGAASGAQPSDASAASAHVDANGEARPSVGTTAQATAVDDDAEFERELAERRRRTPRGRAPRTLVTGSPADRPGAPEDPASAPSEAHDSHSLVPPGATQGRNLPTALITAGVVALVSIICFTQGTFWTVLLTAVIVALGTMEFCAGLQARGFRPATALALTGGFFLPIAAREFGSDAYPVFFGLIVIFSMLWFLWQITPGRPLLGVATTVFAFAYVGGLGGFAGLLLGSRDGIGLILGLALCVITYDVVGYFVGSQFGRTPIAPNTSPNKSIEGTLAGMIAAVLMGWLFVGGALLGGIHPWSPGKGAVLGLLVAAGAFLGDLCESMLKRDLGIKDFGSLLPGHGGVLDRFDAILFCLPIAYYLSVHLNIL